MELLDLEDAEEAVQGLHLVHGPPAPLALEVLAQAGGNDEEDAAQAPPAQAQAPPLVAPPALAPRNQPNLLLRRASVSSLDECSQRGQVREGGRERGTWKSNFQSGAVNLQFVRVKTLYACPTGFFFYLFTSPHFLFAGKPF